MLLVSGRGLSVTAWCETCEARVRMWTPETAARLAGVTARTIYRRAEDGRVHFTETADGALLICSGSLEKAD